MIQTLLSRINALGTIYMLSNNLTVLVRNKINTLGGGRGRGGEFMQFTGVD